MRITEYTVPLGLGRTVALVSDTHAFPPEPVLALLREAKPDYICVAGDLFEKKTCLTDGCGGLTCRLMMGADSLFRTLCGKKAAQREDENGWRLLREAVKLAPVFFSPGNHDAGLTEEEREEISRMGVQYLDNRDITVDGIRFGGVGEAPDESWLDAFCSGDGVKLLLCHRPEYYDRYVGGRSVSLVLSGHAHGGQVRLFGRGLFAPGQGLLPRYTHGIYHGRLVVCAGAANTAAFPRIGNPAEVVLLRG